MLPSYKKQTPIPGIYEIANFTSLVILPRKPIEPRATSVYEPQWFQDFVHAYCREHQLRVAPDGSQLSLDFNCWINPHISLKGSLNPDSNGWHRDSFGPDDVLYCFIGIEGATGTEYKDCWGGSWLSEPYKLYLTQNSMHRSTGKEDEERIMYRAWVMNY